MNLYGHITLGVTVGVLAAHSPFELSFVLLGSLLPDIDHPSSTLGRYNPLVSLMVHRGKCHSVIGCLLMSLPFLMLDVRFFVFVFIGTISHLMGDKLMSVLPRHKKFYLKLW